MCVASTEEAKAVNVMAVPIDSASTENEKIGSLIKAVLWRPVVADVRSPFSWTTDSGVVRPPRCQCCWLCQPLPVGVKVICMW
jgi:hypothetical protein